MTIPTPSPGCHQYQFGRRDYPLPASQTSIQFNFPLDRLTQNVNIKLCMHHSWTPRPSVY